MARPTTAEQAAKFNEDYATWFMQANAEAGGLITRQVAADLLGITHAGITGYAKNHRIRTYTYSAPDGSKTIPLYSLVDTISIGLAAQMKALGEQITADNIQEIFAQMQQTPLYKLADEEYEPTRKTDTKRARERAKARAEKAKGMPKS